MPYAAFDDRTGETYVAFDHTYHAWKLLLQENPSLPKHLRTFCCRGKARAQKHPTPHGDHLTFIHRPEPGCAARRKPYKPHLDRRLKLTLVEAGRALELPFTLEAPLDTSRGPVVADALFETSGGSRAVISDWAFDTDRIHALGDELAGKGIDVLWAVTEQRGFFLGRRKVAILRDTYPYPGRHTAGYEPKTLPVHSALRSHEISWRATYSIRPDPQFLGQFLKGTLAYFDPSFDGPAEFGLYLRPTVCFCDLETPRYAFAGISLQLPDFWCYLPRDYLERHPAPARKLARAFPRILRVNTYHHPGTLVTYTTIRTPCPQRGCPHNLHAGRELENFPFPGDARETARYLFASDRDNRLAYSAPLPESSALRDVFRTCMAAGWCSTGGAYDDPEYDNLGAIYASRIFGKAERPPPLPEPAGPALPLKPRGPLP